MSTRAYARWEDGRKTFGAQISTVRNMSRYAWLIIGSAAYDQSRSDPFLHPEFSDQDKQEKRDALRLMVAFVVSCKHHIRGEYATNYEDYNGLLPPSVIKAAALSIQDELRQVPDATSASISPSESDALLETAARKLNRPSLPLPCLIAHHLAAYFAKARAKGFLDLAGPAGFNTLNQYLNQLTDEMSTVERLGSLPIPAIYGIHLKQVVSIFLIVLPFTLVSEMSWRMIPFVTVYAFILQGIEGIATEIESPFGDDPSDLPLDLMCAELRNETEHIISRLAP